MEITIGTIVKTNYGTGPYVITEISKPCRCPEYVASLSPGAPKSEKHYHFVCYPAEIAKPREKDKCWLGGFRLDGTNVWDDDRLIILPSVQLNLIPTW